VAMMRVPRIQKYDTTLDKEIVEVGDLYFEPKFYDLGKEKDKFKYITTIEKLCRTSMEYYDLINYLRVNMGMNFCSFFHKVNKDNFGKTRIRIEIHHEPFPLYDIVAIILNNRLDNGQSVDMYEVANEVMECHYEGIVGLLPLSVTVHELVHSGKLFIPLQFIDEGFNTFLNRYYTTIKNMDGLTDMLEAKIRLSKRYAEDPEEFIGILKKKYIYVVNKGYDSVPNKIV
jgi:hypothetical protein